MNIKNKTIRVLAGATVALLGVGLAGQAAHAASACEWPNDCITGVGADVYADDLGVGFWTNVQTTAHIQVYDGLGHEVAGTNLYDGVLSYHHSFSMMDKFIPGTGYFYTVDAIDAYGKKHSETYSFTTKNRQVTFTIDKIVVSNDSDWFGAGELYIGYKMGTTVVPLVSHTETSISSGSTWWFKATQVVNKAPQNFRVAVEIQDLDGSYANCGHGTAASWDSGSSPCYDWSTAAKTFVIPSTNGWGDSGTVSFSVNNSVGFTVYGHYHWQVG
jgi:hypothetical protein